LKAKRIARHVSQHRAPLEPNPPMNKGPASIRSHAPSPGVLAFASFGMRAWLLIRPATAQ